MSTSGLRYRLRDATAAAHAGLDRELGALDLTRAADYRVFLEVNAAALLPLEGALEADGVEDILPDWPSRTRRAVLLNDIDRLGGHPRPLPMPETLDVAAMLGTLYVLEGSRLGAAVLLKTVSQSPDPRVVQGTAFLRHGQGRKLWQTFLDVLEREAPTLDERAAIQAAHDAFGLFAHAATVKVAA
jgi:heme oxygenase